MMRGLATDCYTAVLGFMGGETYKAEIPSKVVLADYDRSGSVFCSPKGYEAFVGRAT